MINKNSIKLIGVFVAVIIVFGAIMYFNPDASRQREEERVWKEYNAQFENDTVGGSTPEETLELFISALEKGDIELASKYFIADKQAEALKYLREVKKSNNLSLMLEELSYPYTKDDFTSSGTYFIFDIYNSKDDTHISISIAKGPNDVWKILNI